MLEGPPLPYYPSAFLINQQCTMHVGVVKSLADPDGRGRVQVECPGLLGSGQKNWTCWVENTGSAIGSAIGKGDEGDWWPLQVGQCVLVGFVCGEPDALWSIPGPPPADGAEQLMPAEPKSYNDGRKITRCRIRKSEAGHTLLMDDNGKSELLALMTWTGAGFVAHEPGKEEDEQESPDQESKPRKGPRRETKSVAGGDAPKPSEVIEGSVGYYQWADLMGNGMFTAATDQKTNKLVIKAHKKDGSIGCSFVMDPENETVLISGGKTQIQILGDVDRIFGTKIMILKTKFMEVKDFIKSITDKLKERMKKYSE